MSRSPNRGALCLAALAALTWSAKTAEATQAPDESPRLHVILVRDSKPAQVPRGGAHDLALRETGRRFSHDPATGISRDVKLYLLTLGDTSREDERALGRAQAGFGVFAMNSAQYFPNGDGSWRVFNFRLPRDNDEADKRAFLDFLASADGRRLLEDPYAREDYGAPSGFLYRKMRLSSAELPPPLERASREALLPVTGIFQYNADGTAKLLLNEPYDEEGRAQQVFERLLRETRQSNY